MKNKPRKSGPAKNKRPHQGKDSRDLTHNSRPHAEKKISSKATSSSSNFTGSASLYGFHAVREAWLNPERRIKTLYATDQGATSFEETLKESRALDLNRPGLKVIEKKALEAMTPQGAVHQGLALICSDLPERSVLDIIIAEKAKSDSLILILDQVTDPHNIGAILRSACAFGAAGIVMQRRHAPELGSTLAKTACGALEHVPVAYETNLSRTIETLKEHHYFVYGLDERGEISIESLKSGGKMAFVLGAEGPGIRHLIKEHCDSLVRLPMSGAMPSINVSNAAAVTLYALSLHNINKM